MKSILLAVSLLLSSISFAGPSCIWDLEKIVKEQIELLGNEANLNHLDISEVTSHWAMKKAILDTGFNGDIIMWGAGNTKTMKPIRRLWFKQREQVVSEVEIRVFFNLFHLEDEEKTKNYFIKNPGHLEKYKEFVSNADVVACPLDIVVPIDFGTDPLGMKDFTIT